MGIGFLGLFQAYRVQKRERHSRAEREEESVYEDAEEEDHETGKPRKRKRVRPSGPCLSEVSEPDLRVYPNLASFFYRTLKPGVRPLDPDPKALLSPADGRVIQFGTIDHGEVEQVKGVTYSLEALLGAKSSSIKPTSTSPVPSSSPSDPVGAESGQPLQGETKHIDEDEEFARINGIPYSMPNLFSGPIKSPGGPTSSSSQTTTPTDQSTESRPSSESEVRADLALSETQRPWWSPFSSTPSMPTTLYYIVVYLAPGDYHRFHSPVSWVVSQRRHFAGELYSVSPYLVRSLPGLFTLNERVVLLGRWRYGFFSYTPVGATNVGSIIINFDRELRTNSLNTDTAADRAAAKAQRRGEPYSGFAEATYAGASKVLGGHALRRGEEMGGFQLGSTVVLVFEAPKGVRRSFDEGFKGGDRKGGWRWCVERGQHVQMGQALGTVVEPE
ncbi:MAG: phosphatidylserine decarboxylase 1 [Alyxoria varia]|nr:MAG: phosphatidylserine decarboxylase 1 [Alyxoria varia]